MQGLAGRSAANMMTPSEMELPKPLAPATATSPIQTKSSAATVTSAPLMVERQSTSEKNTERAATVVGNGDSFAAAERIGGRLSMEVS